MKTPINARYDYEGKHGHDKCKVNAVLWFFHNYEHGYKHCKGPKTNSWIIKHVKVNKKLRHVITSEYARGHGIKYKTQWFKFKKKYKNAWFISSGVKVSLKDVPDKYKKKGNAMKKSVVAYCIFKQCVNASEPDFWKDQYSDDMPHWMESEEPSKLAKRFVDEINKRNLGKDILEIGVGNGRDSIFFTKKGFTVKGIDIDKTPVEVARKNAVKNNVSDSTDFKQMDAENLKYSNDTFDGVYTLSVLHSTNLNKSFSQIHRVLKSKGICLCFLYTGTTSVDGDDLDDPLDVSNLYKVLKNKFKIMDDYDVSQEDKIDDENNEPHIHEVKILLLEKT
jgi:ubiquinone/menaquinone biosynthesis C-methylase UbiE